MDELTTAGRFAVWVIPVVFAITLHEVAHGWAAKLFGDRTAERMGRLSLNPLHHVDPVGTLLVPGLLLVFSHFIFGWAKPVPVDWGKLRNPKRDIALVAAAGPGANGVMVLLWMLLARLAIALNDAFVSRPLIYMAAAGIFINLVLLLVNLVPVPPLDGGRILGCLLPPRLAMRYEKLEPYGFIIMLALIATNLLSMLLGGPLNFLLAVCLDIAGIPPGILYHLMDSGS
jgi:Zn-dependent protease